MINKETIQRIMDATHIEEVISEFVSLKKRGANHIGCCPFHNEKTPSFYVSPSKGIFKCFGCGKSGNVVGFLMDHEHFTYPVALHYLAKKYNIEIEEERLTQEQQERQNERDGLFHVSEFAQKYFADLLYNDEQGRAIGLSYFHHRGLSDDIIKTFGLGYCLDKWRSFTDHARNNGYSDTVLEKTGLTIFKEDGKCYDRFRGRVMFPIYSISGRVLGFSGRILTSDKQAAKYVNSPDSDIYDKSHTLYGIYQAKNEISKADKCYLVEGNVDVVSMHQSGVCNTVASCGTSLTVDQIRLIKRYTSHVTILYDGDKAGIKAALRAVNLLFGEGLHVRVVLFPDGEDPDSYAQRYGSSQLQTYLKEHEENFISFKTRVLLDDIRHDPIRKSEVLQEIVGTIALVPDMLERQEYIHQTAFQLQTSEQVLVIELSKAINRLRHSSSTVQTQITPQQIPVKDTAGSPPTDTDHNSPTALEQFTSDSSETLLHSSPHQELPTQHPAENQERQIIWLLLNHGSKTINQEMEDEDGNKAQIPMRVADIIVGDITTDVLSFDHPTFQEIFDLFRTSIIQRQPLPDANYFASQPNNLLRNTAFTLMMDTPPSVSSLWEERKQIVVPNIETHLQRDLNESLLALKEKKLNQHIEMLRYKLRQCNNDDDIMILMDQILQLTRFRQQVCNKLNRVYS